MIKLPTLNRHQAGATLMEVLIAMSISLVVTASMIALMANSLGSTARIIQMTKLTDDLRVAMQMMSRDVRRISYNANSMYCYKKNGCQNVSEVTFAGVIAWDDRDNDGVNDCFTFQMDRDQNGVSTADGGGGFRHVLEGDVGVMEMWVDDEEPDCGVNSGWVQITNPENMDIFGFSVDDNLSYTQPVLETDEVKVSQRIRKVRMVMQGRLVLDPDITRQVEDTIAVRNDLLVVEPKT